MKYLCDTNVWLALTMGQHAHHGAASAWFGALVDADVALFCRSTRISFLRLLTQQLAPGSQPLTNRQAWAVLDQLLEDEAIGFAAEPSEIDGLWRSLSDENVASPKRWMDAYLAAFAMAGRLRLVTFDRGFRSLEPAGLDLLLLEL